MVMDIKDPVVALVFPALPIQEDEKLKEAKDAANLIKTGASSLIERAGNMYAGRRARIPEFPTGVYLLLCGTMALYSWFLVLVMAADSLVLPIVTWLGVIVLTGILYDWYVMRMVSIVARAYKVPMDLEITLETRAVGLIDDTQRQYDLDFCFCGLLSWWYIYIVPPGIARTACVNKAYTTLLTTAGFSALHEKDQIRAVAIKAVHLYLKAHL